MKKKDFLISGFDSPRYLVNALHIQDGLCRWWLPTCQLARDLGPDVDRFVLAALRKIAVFFFAKRLKDRECQFFGKQAMSLCKRKNNAPPAALSLRKVFFEVLEVLLLSLSLKLVRLLLSLSADPPQTVVVCSRSPQQSMPVLLWRSPWWAWQILSCLIATLSAPSFLLIGGLLLINPHSDHPLFWWSLPAIITIANATAILRINHLHQRRPFSCLQMLARRHVSISASVGAILFLLAGALTGFLPDIFMPMPGIVDSRIPALAALLWVILTTLVFVFFSFAHAGSLNAALNFTLGQAHHNSALNVAKTALQSTYPENLG